MKNTNNSTFFEQLWKIQNIPAFFEQLWKIQNNPALFEQLWKIQNNPPFFEQLWKIQNNPAFFKQLWKKWCRYYTESYKILHETYLIFCTSNLCKKSYVINYLHSIKNLALPKSTHSIVQRWILTEPLLASLEELRIWMVSYNSFLT